LPETSDPRAEAPGGSVLGGAFLALCLVYFLNSFIVSPFAALFPVYVEADLERQPWFTGYLRALMLVLGGIFALVSGRLCDLLGRKNTLLLGLAGSMLSGLVFRASDPLVLTLLIFVLGAATGPWSTAGQSYLIASVDPRRLGLGGALYFLSNTAGNSLGSLVTGVLKERWTFPQIGAAMTAALIVAFLLAFLLLPGGGATARTGPAPLSFWSAYRPLLRRREVHMLVGLRSMVTTFWGMASLLLPLLIYRASGSQSLPAYYASVSLAGAAAGQLLTGYLCDRFGRFWPLSAASGGVALSALGLALSWDSLPGLFLFGTCLTGTAWAVSTLIPKLISDVAGPDEKNRLVGLGHLVWSGAMVAGSIAGGLMVEYHPAAPFYAGAALAAGGTLCGWQLCARLDRQGK
jgi:MFS family permease